MDDAKLEKLINQCKSNDVDVKVDALSKLQAEFESGIEITDPEPLISVLKTCLRTPNQHLTTATLSALPPLLPLIISKQPFHPQPINPPRPASVSSSNSTSSAAASLIDAHTLRQVLAAFLPSGGVIDRLGDNREKAREKARETLVVLAGLAFHGGGGSSMSTKSRGTETPLMVFERHLREGGFASKVWRVREQSILTLVHIRRAHHLFPIRAYLPQLVATLEDTDGNVRECARPSVVELFTGPGVTDAARADLKKEMAKKGVRKNIVDIVLAKLVAGGSGSGVHSEGSENGEAGSTAGKKEYIPPSLALQARKPAVGLVSSSSSGGSSRTVSQGNVKELSGPASQTATVAPPPPPTPTENAGNDVHPVYITSTRDLENEFTSMLKPFDGRETEHNWAAREKAILRVRGMLKGDVHTRYADTFFACLKDSYVKLSLKALASLRTTVAAHTCFLYSELAIALGHNFDAFCDTLLAPLLRMAGFTKKIAAQQSQAAVTTILTHCSAQPRLIIPLLWTTLQEKTVQARVFVVAHIKNYLEVHGARSKSTIEASGGAEILEKCIKRSLADANVGVRESARISFWVFESVWHDRGLVVLGTLDSLARKQLEKVCPSPDAAAAVIQSSTPNTKKTSIAAAIAASRAKAKAIATSPPSLRHQATSTSYAARATSPSSTATRASISPPTSPRSRIVSGVPIARITSNPATLSKTISHSRSLSSSSTSTPPETIRRNVSSSLAASPSRGSMLLKAVQTALPASPPTEITLVQPAPSSRRAASRSTTAVPVPPHGSTVLPQTNGDDDDLLLASTIPIPEDSDSDPEGCVNLMSFSTPFEVYPPTSAAPKTNSQVHSFSPKSSSDSGPRLSNALLTPDRNQVQGEIVEDALRARAEQAESAAERLLELVEPEENANHHFPIPVSLLLGRSGNTTAKTHPNASSGLASRAKTVPPVTPLNRNAAILKQASLFKNSPAHNGTSPSLLDVLKDRKNETSWWLKRMNMIEHGTPLKGVEPSDRIEELQSFIVALEQHPVSIRVLQKLALLCIENSVVDPLSPLSAGFSAPSSPSPFSARPIPSLHSDMWTKDKSFERLFNALIKFLDPTRFEDELEYGLIVLWEMLENQALYIEGREADIFSVLLSVRYCNKLNVMEATNTIRDALATQVEPVYGLTTMHASLRAFQADPHHALSDDGVKAGSYAFGMIALGKFILRLPAEVLEDELPRLKSTLISALNDMTSLVIRESAAASIIAAQLVLRDEAHLFALLDGLTDDKKNLLTYLFDKHGTRGQTLSNGAGMEKLEKEMRRLDTRTNFMPTN